MRGDVSTVGLDELLEGGEEETDEALNRAGVGDIVGAGEGSTFAALQREFAPPMRKGAGQLLEEKDPRKVFWPIDNTVLRQERLAKNREEQAKHYKAVRGGNPFSYIEKTDDRSVYKQAVPPFLDADESSPIPNKMASLCQTIINQMLVDAFQPNPKPDGDTDKDRGAADLTKKFLRTDGTASGTNDQLLLREMLNINIAQKSGFAQVWVDFTGGGWRPKQVLAHPEAMDANRPLYGPKKGPDGAPLMGQDGKPLMIEKSSNPVMRYVAETEVPNPDDPEGEPTTQREFTNDPARAARLWLPKIRRTVLLPSQVRTVPQTATVNEAQEIILLMCEPIGEAKKRFPMLEQMSQEQLRTLTTWKPKRWQALIPDAVRPRSADSAPGGPHDDTVIFWYHHYCRIGSKYVDGSEIAVSGANGGIVLKRDTLREDVKLEDGTLSPVLMDPGVAQFIALQDTDGGDPLGLEPMAQFTSGNEAYAQIWMGLLEAMDKAVHLNVMIPSTSPITGPEWRRRDGTPLEVLTSNDKPIFEDPPVVPEFMDRMLDAIELFLNAAAGTNETSSGLDSPFSVSGKAKEIAIKQARVQLAQYWQNTVNGITTFWKLKTQRAQAYLTVPQMVKLSGEESAYKQPYWVGSDLCGISEIALQPGSGTMMAPNEKLQWLGMMAQLNWIDADTAGEMARASMTDDLGLAPNIHEERINRCISEWSKGEPAGWREEFVAFQQYQAVVAQWQQEAGAQMEQLVATGVDPAAAQQQVQTALPAPEPVPEPFNPFDPRPNDGDPNVAAIHYRRVNRMASTAEYGKHGAEWRSLFDAAYQRIAAAAGVKTLEQVAQEQAMAADAQNAALQEGEQGKGADKAAGEQAKAQDKEADRQFKGQEAEKDREHDLEKQSRDLQVKEAAAIAGASPRQPTKAA